MYVYYIQVALPIHGVCMMRLHDLKPRTTGETGGFKWKCVANIYIYIYIFIFIHHFW